MSYSYAKTVTLLLLLRRRLAHRSGVCHGVSHLSVLLCLKARQKDRLVSAFQDNITAGPLPQLITQFYRQGVAVCYYRY